MTCTPTKLEAFIATLPGGVLRSGSHSGTGDCCILEAVSLCDGRAKTDNPSTLDRPDCRALNDAAWSSSAARTAGMLTLTPLLADWPGWDDSRRVAWAQTVALRTIREVLPIALDAIGLPIHAQACRDAETMVAARDAASYAARAASDAGNRVLNLAVTIWAEAHTEIAWHGAKDQGLIFATQSQLRKAIEDTQ